MNYLIPIMARFAFIILFSLFSYSIFSQTKQNSIDSSIITYKGLYENQIQNLLKNVKGWKIPTTLTSNDGILPKVETVTTRDNYVGTALSLAWAAESYFRLGDIQKSMEFAIKMKAELKKVEELCEKDNGSSSLSKTLLIYPCQEVKTQIDESSFTNNNINYNLHSFNKDNITLQVIDYFFSLFPGSNNQSRRERWR